MLNYIVSKEEKCTFSSEFFPQKSKNVKPDMDVFVTLPVKINCYLFNLILLFMAIQKFLQDIMQNIRLFLLTFYKNS